MQTRIAQLSLPAEEDDAFTLEGSLCSQTISYELCMVGKLLSPHRIHVPSFKERVTAMWRLGRGIFVQELDDRQFLFKFFHQYDISRVLENEALAVVSLDSLDFWVQIYNLPVGFISTEVGKQFGDFMGKFIQYDETNSTRFGASYMRVKVQIDVS